MIGPIWSCNVIHRAMVVTICFAVLAMFLGICACQYKQTVRFEATPPRREYWREIHARNRERALQRAAHRRAARRGTTVDFELANFDSWSVGSGGSGGS
jgi:hypothetical protein